MPRGVYPRKPLSKERREQIAATARARGYGRWMVGRTWPEERREKLRQAAKHRKERGPYFGPEALRKMSEAAARSNAKRPPRSKKRVDVACEWCARVVQVGPWEVGNGRRFCSRSCACKAARGPKARNWKGGVLSERGIAIRRHEYREWRTAVFTRDHFACRDCGAHGRLNAHHELPWAKHPEHRYDVANGITLCVSCHRRRHARRAPRAA